MVKLKEDIFDNLLLILVWISFFFSINLNPAEFFEYNITSKIRILAPILLSTLIIFFRYKEIQIKVVEPIVFLFLIIIFLYIFFNLISPINNIINLFWPTYMLLSFFILTNFTNFDQKNLLMKLTLILVIGGFVVFFTLVIIDMFKNSNFHFYGSYGTKKGYGGLEYPPRSSGLSRLALISYAYFSIYYFLTNKKNLILLILISFFAIITLLFQSRTTSFIYLFITIFWITLYFKNFFYDKRLIIFAIIIPIAFNTFYQYFLISKNQIISSKYVKMETPNWPPNNFRPSKITELSENINVFNIIQDGLLRDTLSYSENKFKDRANRINKFSSDRFANWKKAKEIIEKNYFKGHGAQADRLLVNQSIHNSIIYSTLAGGVLAGVAMLLIYLYSVFLLFKFYFFSKIKHNNIVISHFSGILLIIFGLRSLLETSIAVYSIDYLIYLIAFAIFKNQFDTSKIT